VSYNQPDTVPKNVYILPKILFWGERRWAAYREEESPPTTKGEAPQGAMPRGMAPAQKRYPRGEMRWVRKDEITRSGVKRADLAGARCLPLRLMPPEQKGAYGRHSPPRYFSRKTMLELEKGYKK